MPRGDNSISRFGSTVTGNDGYWNSRFSSNVKLMCSNPDVGLRELDRFESEMDAAQGGASFKAFIKMFWHVLEPKQPLIDGWVLDALCDHYAAVSAGHIRKLLINIFPGAMKSIIQALFTAWEWGPQGKAHLRYICSSYSGKLAVRDNERCRDVVKSSLYQHFWGDKKDGERITLGCTVSPKKDGKSDFGNNAKGWRFATSIRGTTMGERGNRVMLDDPNNTKNVESETQREEAIHYVAEVLPTRFINPDEDAFIITQQRTHEGDVSGHILGMGGLGFEHLCVPMRFDTDHPNKSTTFVFSPVDERLVRWEDPRTNEGELAWPDRFSAAYISDTLEPLLRSTGGDFAIHSQLQQRPVPRGGGKFKREWWRFYETNLSGYRIRPAHCWTGKAEPLPDVFDRVIISVDAAFKGEGTSSQKRSRVSIGVIGTKGPFRYLLRNVTRHMEFDETCDVIVLFSKDEQGRDTNVIVGGMLHEFPGKEVIIEDKANGPAIIRTLRKKVSGLIAVTPQGGKLSRAEATQPSVKSGHWLLPDGAPWVIDYVAEMASFPTGTYNDQVDMTTQAHIYLTGSHSATRASMLGNF